MEIPTRTGALKLVFDYRSMVRKTERGRWPDLCTRTGRKVRELYVLVMATEHPSITTSITNLHPCVLGSRLALEVKHTLRG